MTTNQYGLLNRCSQETATLFIAAIKLMHALAHVGPAPILHALLHFGRSKPYI
jgi:hypothetical protein